MSMTCGSALPNESCDQFRVSVPGKAFGFVVSHVYALSGYTPSIVAIIGARRQIVSHTYAL